jgi:hypothetical protein
MKCNVGKSDRIIRVLLGLVLIAVGLYFNSWWGAIGVIPLFTAAIGWCPLYLPFGLTSCSTKS